MTAEEKILVEKLRSSIEDWEENIVKLKQEIDNAEHEMYETKRKIKEAEDTIRMM